VDSRRALREKIACSAYSWACAFNADSTARGLPSERVRVPVLASECQCQSWGVSGRSQCSVFDGHTGTCLFHLQVSAELCGAQLDRCWRCWQSGHMLPYSSRGLSNRIPGLQAEHANPAEETVHNGLAWYAQMLVSQIIISQLCTHAEVTWRRMT